MFKPLTYQHSRGDCNVVFNSFSQYIRTLPYNTAFIIDKNVYHLYPNFFQKSCYPIFINYADEKSKNLSSLNSILTFLHENTIDRNHTIVVVGGGITCDIGAMAASIWKRGCKLGLVPTTLLAMVDAAIGGKTAINFLSVKNTVGTFYHPDTIIIDPQFLKTLPKKVYLEGIPEIIKHALSLNSSLLEKLLEINKNNLSYLTYISDDIIYENIRTKLNIVTSDPEEKNIRKILNLGHTIGHAIEITHKLSHGIAVANGIILELKTLFSLGHIKDPTVLSVSQTLLKPFKTKKINKDIEPLLPFLLQDKKRNHTHISIPVVKSLGSTTIENIMISDFTNALEKVLLSES